MGATASFDMDGMEKSVADYFANDKREPLKVRHAHTLSLAWMPDAIPEPDPRNPNAIRHT